MDLSEPSRRHTTTQECMDLRSRLTKKAQRLLDVLSWLAPDPMPIRHLANLDGFRNSHTLLEKLCDSYLATRRLDGETFTIDPLLQEITRQEQASKKPRALSTALWWLIEVYPLQCYDVRTRPIASPLNPHVIFAATAGADRGIAEPSIRLLYHCAHSLKARADFCGAESLFRQALAVAEKIHGDSYPTISEYLNALAILLNATGRPDEANTLIRRALQIDRDSEGYTHPNFKMDLTNRVNWNDFANNLEETEFQMRRDLKIVEERMGESHAAVACPLRILASLLQDTNRHEDAELHMRRVLQIYENWYGESHPYVAINLKNVASLLRATNRLGEAEPLMRRALRILEDSLGPEHPNSVGVRKNLEFLETEMRSRKPAPESGDGRVGKLVTGEPDAGEPDAGEP
jgi:tetratricopeptide (TPR) repeat protein